MDAKLTLSFDQKVIQDAKALAEKTGLSLSRLTEMLFRKATEKTYGSIYEMPIADWLMEFAEPEAEYLTKPRSNKEMREEHHEHRANKHLKK